MTPNYSEIIEAIEAGAATLSAAVDPEQRAAERAAALQPFGPDGPWRYAPAAEREKAEQAIVDEQMTRAGRALFTLDVALHDAEQQVDAAIAEAQEAPGPLLALERWSGTRGQTRAEQLGVLQLAELQRARFDREYAAAPPSAVLHDYRRALADPYTPEHSTLIAFVEARIRSGWSWPTGTPKIEGEQEAVRNLSRLVRTTRDARIPDDALKAREAIKAARQLAERAKTLHKVRAVRVL